MTVTRKYPTSWNTNNPPWTNPNDVLGTEDNVCMYKRSLGAAYDVKVFVAGFGFAIPAGSTINRITLGFKGSHKTVSLDGVQAQLDKPGWSWIANATNTSQSCASSVWDTINCTPYNVWTIDDLNLENFTVFVEGFNLGQPTVTSVYADAVYIEVDYTEPAPSGGAGISGAGALTLLASIATWFRKSKRKRKIAILI